VSARLMPLANIGLTTLLPLASALSETIYEVASIGLIS
jgi:hypothetical protein